MRRHSVEQWQHEHDFTFIHDQGETRTKQVLLITIVTMVAEIAAGTLFRSMALLADGWHMATHAGAFALTIFSYHYCRRHAGNSEFSFGTGKVTVLGGFASAVVLAVIALFIAVESLQRFWQPMAIRFSEALVVAVLGLVVNLVCAVLLHVGHEHSHHDGKHHDHHHHHDYSLRGAYAHVLADALTSVLAIIALLLGKFFGWGRLDPLMGIVGAVVILRWAYGLLRDTSTILLDKNADQHTLAAIRRSVESDADNKIADMHVWKVGPLDYAAILSVVTHHPRPVEHYKKLLAGVAEISHLTIEINVCAENEQRQVS